ncbi:cell envelope biogenesis protein OmpA [Vibrio rumoiensis 1S-45]|uniref:Cell envelope biogenesis protein OmpA n=2 Tax=Vibrio rumoiensis TaxID=76258 RepID=A0A1E5E6Z3_9VIBR|nr:OmpA family protein [Vibrio rumoiensis]OEF30234.1 cell envelope biogenesis protein OmpA [Vibrio rumoiensis 1S-45]
MAVLLLVTGCSTDTYVSNENVDKFQDPLVSKFYIRECLSPRPNIQVAVVEHFDFDKSALTATDQQSIDDFIAKIKDKHGQISIVGHTDEQGSNAYNDALSQRRAQAVQTYMQQKMDATNYDWEVKHFGETRPAVKGKTLSAYAQNRRAFIIFEEKQIEKDNPACLPPEPKRKVIIAMTSHFDFDKSNLKPKDIESLDEFASKLKDLKGRLLITGNTDYLGSNEYNQALSERRAQSVIEYLKTKLDENNFLWEESPRGELDLLTQDKSIEGNALNRRAFVIFKEDDLPGSEKGKQEVIK